MNKHLFMYKSTGGHEQHTIAEVDAKEADEIVRNGAGTEIDLSDYHGYREKVRAAHRRFKTREEELKNTDDPRYTPEVREYELRKAREDFEQTAQQAQADWERYRAEQIEEARTKAAQATVNVSQGDRQTAKQFADRLNVQASTAANAYDLTNVIQSAKDGIERLSDGQKTALQSDITAVVDRINARAGEVNAKQLTRQTRQLLTATADVRDGDILASKAAEALPNRIDREYYNVKMARKW